MSNENNKKYLGKSVKQRFITFPRMLKYKKESKEKKYSDISVLTNTLSFVNNETKMLQKEFKSIKNKNISISGSNQESKNIIEKFESIYNQIINILKYYKEDFQHLKAKEKKDFIKSLDFLIKSYAQLQEKSKNVNIGIIKEEKAGLKEIYIIENFIKNFLKLDENNNTYTNNVIEKEFNIYEPNESTLPCMFFHILYSLHKRDINVLINKEFIPDIIKTINLINKKKITEWNSVKNNLNSIILTSSTSSPQGMYNYFHNNYFDQDKFNITDSTSNINMLRLNSYDVDGDILNIQDMIYDNLLKNNNYIKIPPNNNFFIINLENSNNSDKYIPIVSSKTIYFGNAKYEITDVIYEIKNTNNVTYYIVHSERNKEWYVYDSTKNTNWRKSVILCEPLQDTYQIKENTKYPPFSSEFIKNNYSKEKSIYPVQIYLKRVKGEKETDIMIQNEFYNNYVEKIKDNIDIFTSNFGYKPGNTSSPSSIYKLKNNVKKEDLEKIVFINHPTTPPSNIKINIDKLRTLMVLIKIFRKRDYIKIKSNPLIRLLLTITTTSEIDTRIQYPR